MLEVNTTQEKNSLVDIFDGLLDDLFEAVWK